jgi:hypothetical protein
VNKFHPGRRLDNVPAAIQARISTLTSPYLTRFILPFWNNVLNVPHCGIISPRANHKIHLAFSLN